jgi:hypothetical protein
VGKAEAVATIQGGIGREDRRRVQHAFTQDKGVEIPVATDAADENINLQRAHLMINVWTVLLAGCDNDPVAKRRIVEHYGRWDADDRSFDAAFWQAQGELAIFQAAEEMIRDYLLLCTGHADTPRLQRTVERFQRA